MERLVGGLISGKYKLLLGAADKLHLIDQNVMTGPHWPNESSHLVPLSHSLFCGRKPENGCLFNIFDDPSESKNIAAINTSIFLSMLAEIDEAQKSVYSPDRGKKDKSACAKAFTEYQGYWGPFA